MSSSINTTKTNKTDSFFKYLLVGGSAFVVDYGVLNVAHYWFDVGLSFAATLGFLSGLIISFSLNRYWVFGSKQKKRNPLKQSIEYGTLLVFNYVFTLIMINILHDLGIEPFIGKLLIMVCIVVWNYIIFKKIIFGRDGSSDS